MDVFKFLEYGWQNILEWLLRIAVAAICGAFIGIERSRRFKDAGIRTHCVVSMSAAVFMIISKYAFIDLVGNTDGSRIASQVVTGISFIGAGAIFKNGSLIRGITTAAGIWATSAIGMAIGSGLYVIGIFATIGLLFIQFLMHKFKFGADGTILYSMEFNVASAEIFKSSINEFFERNNCLVEETKMEKNEKSTKFSYVVKINSKKEIDTKEDIFNNTNVIGFRIKKL